MTESILVIEDDAMIRDNLIQLLSEEGYDVVAADNGQHGIALSRTRTHSLILCDVGMPETDGYRVLRAVRDNPRTSSTPFVFLSGKTERADVRAGMNMGADDYVTKPFTLADVLSTVRTRLRRQTELSLKSEAPLRSVPSGTASGTFQSAGPPRPAQQSGVIVHDPNMRALYEQAARAAASNINILLLGETGVGKEILARAIHRFSTRRDQPFVALNCAALTETLLEAELFGHERGAFTGANQGRIGLLESASGGTVFLDEVGELPPAIQVKLLRVLEERRVLRVGSRTPKEIDVRFISATNRDLEQESDSGEFRSDLYYRLNGISFDIPPLRKRRREIGALARMFLARSSIELGRSEPLELSTEALQVLENYAWPGNVRELRNVIERAVVLTESDWLMPEHLPAKLRSQSSDEDAPDVDDPRALLRRQMTELERRRIIDALDQTGGNQTVAAELLGMSRRNLVYKLGSFGLPRPRKRGTGTM